MNDNQVKSAEELKVEAEQKAEKFRLAKIEASKKMLARKKAAIAVLVALAMKSGTEEEKLAAKYLSGGRQLGTVPTFSPADIFGTEKSIHEDLLFKHKKLGRTEMKKIIKKAEKDGIKITFNPQTGVYTLG